MIVINFKLFNELYTVVPQNNHDLTTNSLYFPYYDNDTIIFNLNIFIHQIKHLQLISISQGANR